MLSECECNGHADECEYSEKLGHGVCLCKNNTAGFNCERCVDGFFQTKGQPMTEGNPCEHGELVRHTTYLISKIDPSEIQKKIYFLLFFICKHVLFCRVIYTYIVSKEFWLSSQSVRNATRSAPKNKCATGTEEHANAKIMSKENAANVASTTCRGIFRTAKVRFFLLFVTKKKLFAFMSPTKSIYYYRVMCYWLRILFKDRSSRSEGRNRTKYFSNYGLTSTNIATLVCLTLKKIATLEGWK
jgi:hypothetical protein